MRFWGLVFLPSADTYTDTDTDTDTLFNYCDGCYGFQCAICHYSVICGCRVLHT